MRDCTNQLRVLFFTTAVEHRTFRKTAKMLHRAGVLANYVGFTRHNYPHAEDGLETTQLGQIRHGNYIRRFLTVIRRIPGLRREARKHDIMYCFSLDALVLGCLATVGTRVPLVYQVQDIRPILIGTKIKSLLSRLLERMALARVRHVVVSSNAYYEHHFKARYGLPERAISVIENKLEHDPMLSYCSIGKIPPTEARPIRIGYFGMLRCPRSWEILKDAVDRSQGGLELVVYGKPVGIERFEEDVSSNSRIFYGGPYRDPDDLEDLYRPVDLVWAAYPYGHGVSGNWQWARTVRFYEAGAFGTPMISQAGTQDASVISRYGIGLNVDMADPRDAVERLLAIGRKELGEWSKNLGDAPRTLFVHTNEYWELKEKLVCLAGDGCDELA